MGFSPPDPVLKGVDIADKGRRKVRIKRNNSGVGVLHRCYRRRLKMSMKKWRRANLEGSRMTMNGVERRIKVLQDLVPIGSCIGLDGLLMGVADYILCLEMKIKVMQIMVKVLDCNEENL